jgi:CAAX protease family protein
VFYHVEAVNENPGDNWMIAVMRLLPRLSSGFRCRFGGFSQRTLRFKISIGIQCTSIQEFFDRIVTNSSMTTPPPRPSSEAPSYSTLQTPYAHTLFFGPDGLRPGWGLLFYVVTSIILQDLLENLAYHLLPDHAMRLALLEKFADVLAALFPALILLRIEHRPWRSCGLSWSQALRRPFWTGTLWGLASISLLVILLRMFHGYDFGHIILHGRGIEKFAAYWFVMFLLVGLYEEFLFRGYSQFTLARGITFWPAAVLSSGAFAFVHRHNPGETLVGLAGVFAIGLFFCLTLRRTGSLWFAIGFHAAWDWSETFLYSVPDSGWLAPGHLLSSSLHGPAWLTGGTAGPEASLFCFVVIALISLVFARTHRLRSEK